MTKYDTPGGKNTAEGTEGKKSQKKRQRKRQKRGQKRRHNRGNKEGQKEREKKMASLRSKKTKNGKTGNTKTN